MRNLGKIPVILVLIGMFSCAGTKANPTRDATTDNMPDKGIDAVDVEDAGGLPAPMLWTGPGEPPVLKGKFYDEHADIFSRISHWFTHVKGPDRPDTGHLGAFGIGNGTIFGIMGMTYPLNTLHEMIGPVYKKGDGFFGDYWLNILDKAGNKVRFDEEWAMRSMYAPVVITRAETTDWRMDTVDFAPWVQGDMRRCIIRVVLITNLGKGPSNPVVLNVHAFNRTWPQDDGTLLGKKGTRRVITGFQGIKGRTDKRNLSMDVPVLQAGQTQKFVLFHCTGEGEVKPPPQFDAGRLLDLTGQAFQAWDTGLLQVDLPDPMVKDFIDGMKQTLKVQTTQAGANCPMSEYTGVWARDSIGPILAWLDLGAFDDATRLLDYIYYGILHGGGLGNSYPADLDISQAVTPIDWDKQPALSGRTGAETPSYMVIEYGILHRFTGLTQRISDRWGFLKYCLLKQEFGSDNLLPFTGDETFRPAMDAAFGLDLSYSHAENSWSANSSFLWLGAERMFEDMANAIGQTADKQATADLAVSVQAGAIKHYLLPDNCFAAYEDKATGKPSPPFEDVALKTVWAGWLNGNDDMAQKALSCLVKRLEVEPGILQSPLDPQYRNFHNLKIEKGLYTGMLPGYTLSVMAQTGYGHAQDAFNAFRLSISTSGNLDEAMIFDDHSGLTLVYDQAGALGDYTAKFRPWEGGITLDAVLSYLVGFVPDAGDSIIRIRPHLPNHWGYAKYLGLRMGDGLFDLEIQQLTNDRISMNITSHAKFQTGLVLRWDCTGTCTDIKIKDVSVKESTGKGMGTTYMETGNIKIPARAKISIMIED